MIDDATARFPLACLYVGKQLDQLRKARDPILRAQGDAYANMGSADMKGNDTSTAVRWYLKWCWFADEEVISRLQAFSTWDEKRAVENKIDCVLYMVGRDSRGCGRYGKRVPQHSACVARTEMGSDDALSFTSQAEGSNEGYGSRVPSPSAQAEERRKNPTLGSRSQEGVRRTVPI